MLITGETVCWVWWDIWELSVLSDKFPINLKHIISSENATRIIITTILLDVCVLWTFSITHE